MLQKASVLISKTSKRTRDSVSKKAPFLGLVAFPPGFEPGAFRLGGGRSILLSYGRICKILDFADEQTRTDRSRYGHILRSHMTYSVINCQDADNFTFFREEHAQRIWWIVFKLLPKEHAELIICYESCFVNADYESILILAMRH